jgi:hypothetical protein
MYEINEARPVSGEKFRLARLPLEAAQGMMTKSTAY